MSKIKLAVVGNENIGKTWLLYTFCDENHQCPLKDLDHDELVFGNRTINMKYDDQTSIDLELIDTRGAEKFTDKRTALYKDVDIFFLCFNVINPSSFFF